MLKIQLWHHRNKIENHYFEIVILFHNIDVFILSDQINAALVNVRDFFEKHLKKSYWPQIIHVFKNELYDVIKLGLEIWAQNVPSELRCSGTQDHWEKDTSVKC